jgi:hypothetical protein
MGNSDAKSSNLLKELSRRTFIGGAAGTGATLAVAPELIGQTFRRSPVRTRRTFFINLSHEAYHGQDYRMLVGGQVYRLRELAKGDASVARERRTNRFLSAVPDYCITHALEDVMASANEVQLSYTIKNPDLSSGQWDMSSVYLILPSGSYTQAYTRARTNSDFLSPLPISSKRKKYNLPAAMTLRDVLEEQIFLDTTDWAATLVNMHPELVSADPNSAAHIMQNHIHVLSGEITQLADVLSIAGAAQPQSNATADNSTGWATLVPYVDDNNTPIKNQRGKNVGLILYDAQWQPGLKTPFIKNALVPALRSVKNDTSLGVDVTRSPASVPQGSVWTRNDGVTSINQSNSLGRRSQSADGANYTLKSTSPSFNGYSCTMTPTNNGGSTTIALSFKNWYIRYLGLYIQFYNSDNKVVPISSLPSGIAPADPFITANNELLIGSLTPEFTIFGIPVQSSSNSFNFTFPTQVASSALIMASGLGAGSHVAQDTEILGIVMTTLFNLVTPAALIGLGVASNIDLFVKQVAVPVALGVAQEFATGFPDGTAAQATAIFWRSFVRGAIKPAMGKFIAAFVEFLTIFEVIDIAEDSIPIAGQIIQAIGVLGTYAELAETTIEVLASPWTYVNTLIGTYDLSVSIAPDPKDPNGFPAAAATYTVTAIFDGGTPHIQTLRMPGIGVKTLPPVVFNDVPLGGMVTITVGFYTLNSTHVGHGTTGSIPNVPPSSSATAPSITITEVQLPITSSTQYQHKQKTGLDGSGNHMWICAPAPQPPNSTSNCSPAPGNICQYRGITYNTTYGNIGYGWQSYTASSCEPNATAQLDQLAAIPGVNSGSNAQQQYAALPCAMLGASKLVYDPLGRSALNFYLDTTNNLNLLRQVTLNPTVFSSPKGNLAWGKFVLSSDDLVLHPSGTVININQASNRLESLALPSNGATDALAAQNLQSLLHGGLGSRPGLFSQPVAATVTADGVILVLESGNNRVHALDVSANPVRYFSRQPTPYFFNLTATTGPNTQLLDIAVDFSGLIYVLSFSNGAYRLDIYPNDSVSTSPLSTTINFNVAKIAVDYWRNVYSLNYEVLMQNGALPASGVTEPSISQWLPVTPPPCETAPQRTLNSGPVMPDRRRLLKRWSTLLTAV